MKETAMMRMLRAIPSCNLELRRKAEELLEEERKQIIDAFNSAAMDELQNSYIYYNGNDFWEKNYNSLD